MRPAIIGHERINITDNIEVKLQVHTTSSELTTQSHNLSCGKKEMAHSDESVRTSFVFCCRDFIYFTLKQFVFCKSAGFILSVR